MCEGIGRVKLAELNVALPSNKVSTPVNTHRKPRVNQVKKVNRAKPMVGVKKESKTLTKPDVPTIYISDNSPIVDVEAMDIVDDEKSPLVANQQEEFTQSDRQKKSSKTPRNRTRNLKLLYQRHNQEEEEEAQRVPKRTKFLIMNL